MHRTRKIILFCILVFAVMIGNAGAQDYEGQVVTGETFIVYFVSTLDIFNTEITFNEKGGMSFSKFEGNGFYFTITSFFVGSYLSLNARIGARTGDTAFILSGLSFDPFIFGTGILIVEYSEIYFHVFFGVREVVE